MKKIKSALLHFVNPMFQFVTEFDNKEKARYGVWTGFVGDELVWVDEAEFEKECVAKIRGMIPNVRRITKTRAVNKKGFSLKVSVPTPTGRYVAIEIEADARPWENEYEINL